MELRRREFSALLHGGAAASSLAGQASAESDPLPSCSAGLAKGAIVVFAAALLSLRANGAGFVAHFGGADAG
jgi:hypothetical protein